MFVPIGGGVIIGSSTGSSTASVTVNGVGSTWTVAGALTVNSAGSLAITNGGAVTVGHPAGSVTNSGIVLIDNSSSLTLDRWRGSVGQWSIQPNCRFHQHKWDPYSLGERERWHSGCERYSHRSGAPDRRDPFG
ncbi:MAG: hypothetical protein ACRD2P_18320 [Terriglobia bacterium]